jgi:protein-S-isoprenylcysteine O-methyltransferase Ste14
MPHERLATMTTEPTGNERRTLVAWSFVVGQFALIGLMVVAPRDDGFAVSAALGLIGIGFFAAGALVGLWSAIHLGDGLTPSPLPNGAVALVVSGPYRWIRHPMYVSVMLIMGGVAIRSGSLLVVVGLAALIMLFNVKARWEEARLAEVFDGYGDYALTTRRFLPVWPKRQS